MFKYCQRHNDNPYAQTRMIISVYRRQPGFLNRVVGTRSSWKKWLSHRSKLLSYGTKHQTVFHGKTKINFIKMKMLKPWKKWRTSLKKKTKTNKNCTIQRKAVFLRGFKQHVFKCIFTPYLTCDSEMLYRK